MSTVALKKPRPRVASRYGNIKTHQREDIPVRVRSGWEANVYRLLRWLHSGNRPLDPIFSRLLGPNTSIWQFEHEHEQGTPIIYYFPGSKATGNAKYIPDFPIQLGVINGGISGKDPTCACYQYYVEVKGRLKEGGWLLDVNLEQLRDTDNDSRIKLERFKKYYPGKARDTLLLGDREYKQLVKAYAKIIPNWE